MIYAIEAVGSGMVKFGRAKNPKNRLKELSTGSPHPLRLLAMANWNDDVERLIHAAFRHLRVNGEWFKEDDHVKMFIAYMMENPHGVPNYAKESRYGICMQILVEMLTGWSVDNYGAEPCRLLEFDEWEQANRQRMAEKRRKHDG